MRKYSSPSYSTLKDCVLILKATTYISLNYICIGIYCVLTFFSAFTDLVTHNTCFILEVHVYHIAWILNTTQQMHKKKDVYAGVFFHI